MRTSSISIVALGALLLTPGIASAQPGAMPTNYSADIIMTLPVNQPGMPGTINSKMYKLGKKNRVEMSMAGQQFITISDGDAGTVTTIMPGQKMAMRMKSPDVANNPMNDLDDGKIKPVKVGSETIDGQETTKYEIKSDQGQTVYYWLGQNDMPVQLVSKSPAGDVTINYKNVKIGPPDASLFEVPEGYTVTEQAMPQMPAGTP